MEGVCPWPFEVVERYTLLLIGLAAQRNVVPQRLRKGFHPLGKGVVVGHPVLIRLLRHNDVGHQCPVHFWGYDALAQEAAQHPIGVCLPRLFEHIDGQRGKERDILPLKPLRNVL